MNRTELVNHISETYSADAEYPFVKYPDVAVFRHANNRKWFAVIMSVQKRKLGADDDRAIDIVNLKCDPILAGSLRNETGLFPAYHMSKTNWISAALDGSVEAEKIKWLLDLSFELTSKKVKAKKER